MTFFDPAESQGLITPFMVLYARHDALIKPMPGQPFAPALAESWSLSRGSPTRRRTKISRFEPDQRGRRS